MNIEHIRNYLEQFYREVLWIIYLFAIAFPTSTVHLPESIEMNPLPDTE